MSNVKGFMIEDLTDRGDKFVAWHTNQFGQIALISETDSKTQSNIHFI